MELGGIQHPSLRGGSNMLATVFSWQLIGAKNPGSVDPKSIVYARGRKIHKAACGMLNLHRAKQVKTRMENAFFTASSSVTLPVLPGAALTSHLPEGSKQKALRSFRN